MGTHLQMAMSYCNDLTLSDSVKAIVGSEQLVPLWLEHGNGLEPIKLSSHNFAAVAARNSPAHGLFSLVPQII